MNIYWMPMEQLAEWSDEALMERVSVGGDRKAFEQLYHRHARRVMGFFAHMLGPGAGMSAEDCVQEVFLRVYRGRASYHAGAPFSTWLYTMAYNLCKNEFRHRAVVNAYREDYRTGRGEEAALQEAGRGYDGAAFERRLQQCLDELPPEQRVAFMLRYREEMPVAEIARIQACPEGTVKSRLHAAVTYLSEKLKAYR